jgi:hypothetical protein
VDAVGPDVAPPIGPVVDETPVEAVIDTGPVNLERLEYASAPPPPYPPEAARRRIEGTVVLRVLVDVDGKADRSGRAHQQRHACARRVRAQVRAREVALPTRDAGRHGGAGLRHGADQVHGAVIAITARGGCYAR